MRICDMRLITSASAHVSKVVLYKYLKYVHMQMAYFIGNVLPTAAEAIAHEESGDQSFHISTEEAQKLEMTDLPLRIEHSDGLEIGKVVRSWDSADGRKWIIGELNKDTLEGNFACRDALSDSPLYTGLSLQHVYTEYTDSTSDKRPVEISVCKVPRRNGCEIRCVLPVCASTKEKQYKTASGTSCTMSETTPTDPTPNTSKAPEPANAPTPADAPEPVPDNDPEKLQLMQETVKMAQERDAEKRAKEELESKLRAYEDEKKREVEKKANENRDFIEKMTASVLEQVAKASPELSGHDTESAIQTLRDKYPNECRKVLEVACCASNRVKQLEAQLASKDQEYERRKIEEKYYQVVNKDPNVHASAPVEQEMPVRASKRPRAENPYAVKEVQNSYTLADDSTKQTAEQIREAYRSIHQSGNTLDTMGAIADIARNQRRAGFR